MGKTKTGYTNRAVSPGGQRALPISRQFGPGVLTIPGTSITTLENTNAGQSDRAIKRNPTASTNQRQIARPVSPAAYSN
jgi:hypothetical protein